MLSYSPQEVAQLTGKAEEWGGPVPPGGAQGAYADGAAKERLKFLTSRRHLTRKVRSACLRR